MDAELARLMTMVDHGDDDGAVERWFAALDRSFRDDEQGQAGSWDEFVDRFRDAADSLDADVDRFLTDLREAFDDPLRIVERFTVQVGPQRAVPAYEEARTAGAEESPAEPEPDWEGFAAFLDGDLAGWQATWPDSRATLVRTARGRGFTVEIESFEWHHDHGWALADNLERHGAVRPVVVAPWWDDEEEADDPHWEGFTAFLTERVAQRRKRWDTLREDWVKQATEKKLSREMSAFVATVESGTSLDDALYQYGVVVPGNDWQAFAALLSANRHRWTMPPVAFYSWLEVEARERGLATEAARFVTYARAGGSVPQAARDFHAR